MSLIKCAYLQSVDPWKRAYGWRATFRERASRTPARENARISNNVFSDLVHNNGIHLPLAFSFTRPYRAALVRIHWLGTHVGPKNAAWGVRVRTTNGRTSREINSADSLNRTARDCITWSHRWNHKRAQERAHGTAPYRDDKRSASQQTWCMCFSVKILYDICKPEQKLTYKNRGMNDMTW